MRRIAVINQKGGVGKTTTCANLGAALARLGRRVVLIDMDAQANLSISLNVEAASDTPSTYTLLIGQTNVEESLRPTATPGLRLLPSNIDLSGAELELASAMGREHLMRDALREWEQTHRERHGEAPADYVIFDCPPSLGLLSINALAAAREVVIAIQTEFLALQGMTKLMDVVQLLKRRLNPELEIAGILPCLYDSRLKLAREVLADIRNHFPEIVMPHPVRANVKLAEAPSFGQTIFEYAPDSNGAQDYIQVARDLMAGEADDADLARTAATIVETPEAIVETPEAIVETPEAIVETPAAIPVEPTPEPVEDLATVVLVPHVPIAQPTPVVVSAPMPVVASKPTPQRAELVDDLPALPPDAFEILESYIYDR